MTADDFLDALAIRADAGRAVQMAGYHKVPRRYLGVANPDINDLSAALRQSMGIAQRTALAADLWRTDIFEARVAAAKLLTQARIRPDHDVWDLVRSWVVDFDSWAIADHACAAGQRRLVADPARLDAVEAWTQSPDLWTRRAALVITLPWTKQNFPSEQVLADRERILGWAAGYASERNGILQKALAWWLRDLSRHAPDRTRAFVEAHGSLMRPYAVTEALRHIAPR